MLHLRRCILTRLLSSPATSPISPLHRLLSGAVHVVSPSTGFTAEQYLVDTCGLTRAQALKASPNLSHLKSPTNPDAVLTFLTALGLSIADVADLVAKDPKFLCAGVERTLAPVLARLTGLGLSCPKTAHLVSLFPLSFRCRSIISNMPYCLSLFGSYENLLLGMKRGFYLICSDLESAVKPNVAILRECGLGACYIAKLCIATPRMLLASPEHFQAMVACAEDLGVPRSSVMFRHALHAVAFLGKEKIDVQVEYLKNTFSWSDVEVSIARSKAPTVQTRSKESLQRLSEFLISEMGLEPAYIAHRQALLSYSLEGRLRPRYYVVKFLKENSLLDRSQDYYHAVALTKKLFMEKFISPP